MTNYARFLETFEKCYLTPHGNSLRWDAFKWIASHLYSLNRPVKIVETGTLRQPGNWLGDGQSSKLWEYIAATTGIGSSAVGVDISRDAVEIARLNCPDMKFYQMDSITFLSDRIHLDDIDLLYLDSYDLDPPYPLSMLHHIGELAAVWERLPSGCLIAVDDCMKKRLTVANNLDGVYDMTVGKHKYIKQFMDDMDIKPVVEGYVTVWVKP